MELSKYAYTAPVDLDVPHEIDAAWMKSYEAWKKLAIEQPVTVQWIGKDGSMSKSKVHVFGIAHNSPANFRAVTEVVERVKPSAIGVEEEEDTRSVFRNIRNSSRMLPLLSRLTETPITSVKQAMNLMSAGDRQLYERGLMDGNIGLGNDFLHYVFCLPEQSECRAAAFLCRKNNIYIVSIDTDSTARKVFSDSVSSSEEGDWWRNWILAARSLFLTLFKNKSDIDDINIPEGKTKQEIIQNHSLNYDRGLVTEVQRWISDSRWDEVRRSLKTILSYQFGLPLTGAQDLAYNKAMLSSEALSANIAREAEMDRRIRLLSSGIVTGKPCKKLLVIVGQNHVNPLLKLLGERPS